MKKKRFVVDGLAGDIYFEPNIEPTAASMFLFGFPAFIGPNPMTHKVVSAGYLSFQPHYLGTYDSDGQFSPKTLMETCKISQRCFDTGRVYLPAEETDYLLPAKLSILVGHSFGCFAAIRGVQMLPNVKLLILMAPAVHYRRNNPDYGLKEDGIAHFESVRRAWPRTYRMAALNDWIQVLEGRDPLPSNKSHLSLQEVHCIIGANDKYFDMNMVKKNIEKVVRAYVGSNARFILTILPDCGHYIDELVNQSSLDISALLKRIGDSK